MKMNEVKRQEVTIGSKTFGIEVSEYKSRMMLTAREMYLDDDGELVYGKNGISLNITPGPEAAIILLANIIVAVMESADLDYDAVIGHITPYVEKLEGAE